VRFDVSPGTNFYIMGQNTDLFSQPLCAAFLSAQISWRLADPLWMVFALGAHGELVGRGHNWLYGLIDKHENLRLEPLFAGRMALRMKKQYLNTDFAFHFAQNLDTGIAVVAKKSTNLSFDIDFSW